MSPSVFLPTMEEGNNIYKGQCRSISLGDSGVTVSPAGPGPPPASAGKVRPGQDNRQLGARACCPSLF